MHVIHAGWWQYVCLMCLPYMYALDIRLGSMPYLRHHQTLAWDMQDDGCSMDAVCSYFCWVFAFMLCRSVSTSVSVRRCYSCVYLYVCVCMYMCIYTYTYIYIYMNIHIYVTLVCICVLRCSLCSVLCLCARCHLCPVKSRSVCMCTCTCTCMCMCMCMYVCVYDTWELPLCVCCPLVMMMRCHVFILLWCCVVIFVR